MAVESTAEYGSTRGQAGAGAPPAEQVLPETWRRCVPRPETVILLLAFCWTVGAKLVVVQRHKPEHSAAVWSEVAVSDLVFFAGLLTLIRLAYALGQHRWAARCALAATALVLGWALANAAWLLATGAQLQPDILQALSHDPLEFWPVVRTHLSKRLSYAIPIGLTVLLGVGWLCWRLARPLTVPAGRRRHLGCALAAGVVFAVALLGQAFARPGARLGLPGEVLSFSSHWYALISTLTGGSDYADVQTQARHLPRAGERRVGLPRARSDELPNVVLLLLESVSYSASALDDPARGTMPHLAALASQGVEFRSTRVPVSQTTKAFWSVLTGTTPDLEPDYVEAVLADEPYDGLPSILARCGYRSAFFEVSKGSFECAAGLFANLGFDWAWFRENLGDPSAHLGYLGGDDFLMLAPAFEWVDAGSEPFLLMVITSVAHDPYAVPEWYGQVDGDVRAKYLHSVGYTDAFIGALCEQLQARGLDERTILCVMGDHGVGFRSQDRFGRWVPLEEVIRVPWVMRWPGHLPAGRRFDWPCSQLDLTPTVLSLIGFDISRAGFEGRCALTPCDPQRRLYFSSWFAGSPSGYIEGSVKYIYWPYNDLLYRYDLASDPGEESPQSVTGRQKERAAAELARWRRQAQFVIHPRRFRERLAFDHWRAFSAGRSAWAYYVP